MSAQKVNTVNNSCLAVWLWRLSVLTYRSAGTDPQISASHKMRLVFKMCHSCNKILVYDCHRDQARTSQMTLAPLPQKNSEKH